MLRPYFCAYHSYLENMELLNSEERGRLFTALLEYSKDGTLIPLTGNERFVFPGIRSQIDRDKEQWKKTDEQQEFMSDVSQQYNDVTKELYQNQLKLTEAQTKGEAASKGMDETYQKLLSTLGMTDDEFQKTYGSVSAIAGVHLDPEIADEVMDLRDSYEEYSNQQLEAAENEKVYQQAVDDGIAKQGEAQQAIEDAQTAYENLEAAQSGATSSASEGAAELGQAISDVTVEAQKLVEAYNTAYDAAEKSIGGQYEIWA